MMCEKFRFVIRSLSTKMRSQYFFLSAQCVLLPFHHAQASPLVRVPPFAGARSVGIKSISSTPLLFVRSRVHTTRYSCSTTTKSKIIESPTPTRPKVFIGLSASSAVCTHYFSARIIYNQKTVCTSLFHSGANGNEHSSSSASHETEFKNKKPIKILHQGPYHVVVAKPPSVVCHHSEWSGLRKKKNGNKQKQFKRESAIVKEDEEEEEEEELPMLQQVRDALGGQRVNLIHRLDRGASGCLLFSFSDNTRDDQNDQVLDGVKQQNKPEGENFELSMNNDENGSNGEDRKGSNPTAQLIQSLQSPDSIKTYVALVRGEGILHGTDLKSLGWFTIDRPIKDENGRVRDAFTEFKFLAGYTGVDDDNANTSSSSSSTQAQLPPPRASVVLARPHTGRWHQIRRHLNGLSHPILGDSTHGVSKINREWRARNMLGERTCLHLARIQLTPTVASAVDSAASADGEVLDDSFTATASSLSVTNVLPNGLDVSCPIPNDMYNMIADYMPKLLEEVIPLLKEEGITFDS